MNIEVLRATTTEQKEQCYKVRYDVFIKETRYIQSENGRSLESDTYDSLDTTSHFLAYIDGIPAGTIRLLLPNTEISRRQGTYFGLPIEELFDIKHYTTSNLHIAEASRLAIRERFKSTRMILDLWDALLDFAAARNITDLVISVNPETDNLCEAYALYDQMKLKNLVDKKIAVRAKKPDIGRVRNFRFPLIKNSLHSNDCNSTVPIDVRLPKTLKLFTKIGSKFTGEPVYSEKIGMCAIPMNLKVHVVKNILLSRFFERKHVRRACA